MAGRAYAGGMVCDPPPILNAIVSNPGFPFASNIAWRREPGPESLVVRTVKVAKSCRSSRISRCGWQNPGRFALPNCIRVFEAEQNRLRSHGERIMNQLHGV